MFWGCWAAKVAERKERGFLISPLQPKQPFQGKLGGVGLKFNA